MRHDERRIFALTITYLVVLLLVVPTHPSWQTLWLAAIPFALLTFRLGAARGTGEYPELAVSVVGVFGPILGSYGADRAARSAAGRLADHGRATMGFSSHEMVTRAGGKVEIRPKNRDYSNHQLPFKITHLLILIAGVFQLGFYLPYRLGFELAVRERLPAELLTVLRVTPRPGAPTPLLDVLRRARASTTTGDMSLSALIAQVKHDTGRSPGGLLGWSLTDHNHMVVANPESAVLVLGPPRTGKTTASLIPSVLLAPGPVVSTSIKTDVLEATAAARTTQGRLWHFDPDGHDHDHARQLGAIPVHWSPITGVQSWEDALLTGASMGQAAQPKAATRETYWIERATDWLQVLLYAAHLGGKDASHLSTWATRPASLLVAAEVEAILEAAQHDGDQGAEIALTKLKSQLDAPPEERGSVATSLASLVRVYDSPGARAVGTPAPNPDHNFDPAQFVRSTDTLYITARPDRQAQYAPLLGALLQQIRYATYDRHKATRRDAQPPGPHVTFVLDEANNTAPLPIPTMVAEAGGQGLHLIVAFQSLGAAVDRWGEVAHSFLTLFPTKIIYPGIFEKTTTDVLAVAAGEFEHQRKSYSIQADTITVGGITIPTTKVVPSISGTRETVLTPGDITALPAHHVMIWQGPQWDLLYSPAWPPHPAWNPYLNTTPKQNPSK